METLNLTEITNESLMNKLFCTFSSKSGLEETLREINREYTILYKKIAELIRSFNIDLVVGIGNEISKHKTFFNSSSLFYQSTDEFYLRFNNIKFQFSSSTILLKGARSFGFERISQMIRSEGVGLHSRATASILVFFFRF